MKQKQRKPIHFRSPYYTGRKREFETEAEAEAFDRYNDHAQERDREL